MKYDVAKQPGAAHITPAVDFSTVPDTFTPRGRSFVFEAQGKRLVWSFGRALGRDVLAVFNRDSRVWTYVVLLACGSYVRAAIRKNPEKVFSVTRQNVAAYVHVRDGDVEVFAKGRWQNGK